jgi:uncharacterized protein (TIGR03435 family)
MVALGWPANGQTTAESPESSASASVKYVPAMTFDVASVKESKPNVDAGFTMGGGFSSPGTLRMQNMDIKGLVLWAYGINELRVDWPKDVPDDLTTARFSIEAKCDAETDERLAKLSKADLDAEQHHMMQTLLQERFGLKAQWVTRDAKTYELVVVKAGRMKSTGAPPSKAELAIYGDRRVPSLYTKWLDGGVAEHIAHGASMEEIAAMLAVEFRHPVTDKTGLTGKYDFDLKSYQVYAAQRKDDETSPYPTLSGAILDQLGLKLIPGHGTIPILVVESVGRLLEN